MRVPAVLLVGVLLAGCTTGPIGSPSTPPGTDAATASATASTTESASTEPAPDPAPTPDSPCTAEASALSPAEQAGQLVMSGVGVDLTAAQRAAITTHHVGSAIVMGDTPGGVAQVARLTAELRKLGGDTGMLVAADQEGGLVQRLKGPGFGTIPSASRQASFTDAELAERATGWGRSMAKAGVLLNLAPVADVVPVRFRAVNQPVARLGRGYGSSPAKVSAKVGAFSMGMRAANVAVAVKHFPGLGAVQGNTDFASRVVDSTTTADSRLLVPFRDAVADGAESVMVSSAYYTRIDPRHPAVFSSTVIGLLREWGFDGVVISDDLGAAAALKSVPVRERALRFIESGGDLALTVDASTAPAMVAGLVAAAKADPDVAARVTESAARVLALKAALGQYHCG